MTGQDIIYNEDCIQGMKKLPDNCVDCCVTSPSYYRLRDYGVDGQIGLEDTPEQYVAKMVDVFREVKRVLKPEGTLWLNLGDSYATGGAGRSDTGRYIDGKPTTKGKHSGERKYRSAAAINLKPKDLIGIPWRVAFALQADGWWLRQDIIWAKPNPMPESVTDRCTKAHEYIFLLSKSARYYYDHEAIKERTVTNDISRRDRDGSKLNNTPGRTKMAGLVTNDYDNRNKRSVWTITTTPYSEAHFATFPEKLIEPCILAGCPKDGTVLDPFMGSGTTGRVAVKFSRHFIGYEINPEYIKLCDKRTDKVQMRLI